MSTARSGRLPPPVQGHRHLLTGSAVLVASAAIQALSGAVFWLVAARLDDQADVGRAGKLFASVVFVTYLAGLGLPVTLARYAAGRSAAADVTFSYGVLATISTSVVFGASYVALFHGSVTSVLIGFNPVLGPLLFAVLVAGTALSLIVDVRCMTLRRWNVVLGRIAVVGLVRFPLLFLFRDHPHRGLWLFVAATGPVTVSGLVGASLVPRLAGGRHRLSPRPPSAGRAVRYSAVNYLSTLAYQAPYFLLPVIVLANVGDDTYASFNVSWGVVAVVFYVPAAIGQAVLAEGGRNGAHVRHQVQLALAMAMGLMVAAALAVFVGKGLVTTVYGPEYRDATRVLPAMVAAGIPWAVTSLYLSEVRILHRHGATVAITVVLTVAILVPALVLVPDDGLDGASAAWLFGNTAAAVVALGAAALSRRRSSVDPSLADPVTAGDAVEVGLTVAEPTF